MRQWLNIRYTKPATYVSLTVLVAPGQYQTFSAAVNNQMVRRLLERAGVTVEVGFSLGKIWKAVKKVAKKTGIAKVVSLAKNALPAAAKFLPPPASFAAAGASLAINTASDLAKAAGLRKKGRKKEAHALVRNAATRAAVARKHLGKHRTSRALKSGAKLYRLQIQPV